MLLDEFYIRNWDFLIDIIYLWEGKEQSTFHVLNLKSAKYKIQVIGHTNLFNLINILFTYNNRDDFTLSVLFMII